MYKVDLHTHSEASPDGGITKAQYIHAVKSGLLDCIAITDHNRLDFAADLYNELGEHIIVGEEIMTTAGEIIGLFLVKHISNGLSPQATIRAIKDQDGLVYIPHPFESVRHGLHPRILEDIIGFIDIFEVYNGRAFIQDHSKQAVVFAKMNHLVKAASSDAHGVLGLGRTYTAMPRIPNRQNILQELKEASLIAVRPTLRSLLYPKYHRTRKFIKGDRS